MNNTNNSIVLPFEIGGDSPMNPTTAIVFSVYISFVLSLMVTANALIIVLVFTYKSLYTPSNVLLASLATTDLMSGIVVFPVAAYYTVTSTWKFGFFTCKLWSFGQYALASSSILHLCTIAGDRYFAILRPIDYVRKHSIAKAKCIAALTWVMAVAIVGPPFVFDWGMVWPEEFTDDTPCSIPQVGLCTIK